MNVRRPAFLLATIASAALLAACGGSSGDTKTASAAVPADASAVVDGKPILKKDVDHLVAITLAGLEQRQAAVPAAGTPEYDAVTQQATRVLFQRAVVMSEAAKHGIKVDADAVKKSLNDAKGTDAAAWQKQLTAMGASEADYTDTIAVQQLAKALRASVVKDAPVTDAEVAAQYAKDRTTVYSVPAARKVMHILIGPADGSAPAAKDWARYKTTAESVIKQLQGGAQMKSLVERFSTDKRKAENEGIYDVTRSGFDKTFTEAAYALKTGAYTTKPVKTPFGYHVIQALAAPTEAGFKPLAEVAEQIRAALADKRSDSAAAAWFDRVQAEYETKTTFADGYGLPAAT
jgi:parvulin-like peptidyl-prolyl isomerase